MDVHRDPFLSILDWKPDDLMRVKDEDVLVEYDGPILCFLHRSRDSRRHCAYYVGDAPEDLARIFLVVDSSDAERERQFVTGEIDFRTFLMAPDLVYVCTLRDPLDTKICRPRDLPEEYFPDAGVVFANGAKRR